MPRPLVVGNGNLLVGADSRLDLRDFYWPQVGHLNHLSGFRGRVGVWVDHQFHWVSDDSWRRELGYEGQTLVTSSRLTNDSLRICIRLQECVLHNQDIYLRRFEIQNLSDALREVRLFLSHDLHICETDIGDTAFYNPFLDAVIHYKRDNYFLISGSADAEGVYQYSTGIKGFGGAEGTWRDAEDGTLGMNPVAQGSVDSTLSFRGSLGPTEVSIFRTYIAAGASLEEVTALSHSLMRHGYDAAMDETRSYWRAWATGHRNGASHLPPDLQETFDRSLLTIRTNIDNHGAIIAANDSDIMETARAHYSYMWPRDGALVAHVLDRLGFEELTRRFYRFIRGILPKERGALLHKYSADGSWGATWHPWTVDGHHEIPFQEDGTALVIWSLWNHYERYHNLEFIEELYEDMIVRCADFLAAYRSDATGLPLPSYDLWEERRGVHAYTCGTVYGALISASRLAELFSDDAKVAEYRRAAAELRQGMLRHLWSEPDQRFARRLTATTPCGDEYEKDMTIDSALHALTAFGAFAPDDPHIVSTMEQVIGRLTVQTPIGGVARYEDDYYFRKSHDIGRIPGNPWIICTLWMTQWQIARATSVAELETALKDLYKVRGWGMETGILPEQVHPDTGQPLSVAPLTWSHAEFVATALDYLDRKRELGAN